MALLALMDLKETVELMDPSEVLAPRDPLDLRETEESKDSLGPVENQD